MARMGRAPTNPVSVAGADALSGIDRSIVSSQLLFSVFVLAVVGFEVLSVTHTKDPGLFYGGSLAIIVAGAAAIMIPWERIDRRGSAMIPLVDIIGIGFMHLGMPQIATGVLWVFPVMWLGAYLPLRALVVGMGLSFGFIFIGALREGESGGVLVPDWVVLPLMLMLVAVASSSSSRRVAAQRQLQLKQSQLLAKALARARSQEVLMAEILDAVSFGIVRVSASGEITLMNRAQERFERIRGEDDDIYDGDGALRLPPEESPLALAMAGEVFTERLVWYGRAERERVALSVTAVQLRADSGERGDVLVVFRDVTEQINAIRARDDLLSSVSHELRTPLTSMIGYIELVLDEPDLHRNARRQLGIAQRNGERLLDLITQILEASRGNTAEVALEPEWADVSSIVRQAVESQELRAAERGIRIDISSLRPCQARIDPSRIRQVVDNMLSNAIKYNREFGLVRIDVEPVGHEVMVQVSDTGYGVTPEELPRVFERHFRSERVRNSSIHGHGLGLSISRDIARQHGGDLELESTPGEGSTIRLVLPTSGPVASEAST
ncbi:MAG TPA: HAMP domain-containing sensor histidine kinase [Microbacteriaceae bacterium]|nr:HAMP domain-containing sensor histidine kinase [Microbacteriaceae bacterium]